MCNDNTHVLRSWGNIVNPLGCSLKCDLFRSVVKLLSPNISRYSRDLKNIKIKNQNQKSKSKIRIKNQKSKSKSKIKNKNNIINNKPIITSTKTKTIITSTTKANNYNSSSNNKNNHITSTTIKTIITSTNISCMLPPRLCFVSRFPSPCLVVCERAHALCLFQRHRD